jgi:undecaprenyl-diphosphatase
MTSRRNGISWTNRSDRRISSAPAGVFPTAKSGKPETYLDMSDLATKSLRLDTVRASGAPRRDLDRGPGSIAPVLDAKDDTARSRLATAVGEGHPIRTFVAGIAVSYVAIAGLSILLGLLVIHVILSNAGIASADESFVDFLARHRSPGLTEASLVASTMAGGVVLPIIAGVFAVAAALLRQWRLGAFLVFALAVESASYRTTTMFDPRHRPTVPRLEHLPVNASYPSGHTAASIAIYCGLALLVTSRIASRWARSAIWLVAVSIPVYVALGRMYRGMHHPLDVLGGVAIGVVTLVAMVLVCRAAGIAAAPRDGD